MPRIIRIFAVAALALSLTAGIGSASTLSWGVQAFAGYNTHNMDDWNKIIDDSNTSSGSNFDNIESGISFGGGPTLTVNKMWRFGAHFEKITPKKSEDQARASSSAPTRSAATFTTCSPRRAR